MKLDKKKALASKVFGVGKERIIFVEPRLAEIKEAITKEDIRGLKADGAIIVKEIKGRQRNKTGRKRRTPGNIRKIARNKKREYMLLTRKLRSHVAYLKSKKELSKKQAEDLRKKIRSRYFKNKSQLKEYISTLKK